VQTANTTGTNTTNIQQAVPININSSLSQVLKQFSSPSNILTTQATPATTTSVISAAPIQSNLSDIPSAVPIGTINLNEVKQIGQQTESTASSSDNSSVNLGNQDQTK
jgi:hypothetical protein